MTRRVINYREQMLEEEIEKLADRVDELKKENARLKKEIKDAYENYTGLYGNAVKTEQKLREENALLKEKLDALHQKLENCRAIDRCVYHDSCPNEGCVFDDIYPDKEPPAPKKEADD